MLWAVYSIAYRRIFFEAAQQKLAESARLLNLSEHRLRQLLAQPVRAIRHIELDNAHEIKGAERHLAPALRSAGPIGNSNHQHAGRLEDAVNYVKPDIARCI